MPDLATPPDGPRRLSRLSPSTRALFNGCSSAATNSICATSSRVDDLENALTELRVNLPLEYVRREDWIRFSGTLDAKLDAMREEMREQIAEVKERLYAGRN